MNKRLKEVMHFALVSVEDAVTLREAASNPRFYCAHCGEPVRPHRQGEGCPERFEHVTRNPECPNTVGGAT